MEDSRKSFGIKLFIGVYLVILIVFSIYLLVHVWPVPIIKNGEQAWEPGIAVFGGYVQLADEIRLLILVILSAGVGSYIHAATSFASYVGNNSFRDRWTCWYLMRSFIGMALALVFYFVIRGGLLSVQSGAAGCNPYGIAAVAGLVGIFSKQATDKLEEVFTNLFRTAQGEGDDERADKLGEVIPVKEVMVPLKKIRKVTIDDQFSDVNLTKIMEVIKDQYTRVPIFTKENVCLYVIHQSLLYKFIVDKMTEASWTKEQVDSLTLKNFLAHDDVSAYVSALAAVPETATLGHARTAMERTPNCQDVLVTSNGDTQGTVLGWITNVDITRFLKTSAGNLAVPALRVIRDWRLPT